MPTRVDVARRAARGRETGGEAEREADVRVVNRRGGDRVGDRRRIPHRADPRRVHVAGAVDDRPGRLDDDAEVAGRVADVDILRRRLVDAHVGDVMQRGRRWDRVDGGRHRHGDGPRSGDLRRREPDARDDGVVGARTGLDDRFGCVDDIRQRRTGERRTLRRSVERRRELGPVRARHRRGLRNRVGDRRFLRLRGARHRRQHRAGERMRRNAPKTRGHRVARHERPRPRHRCRGEPAAGEQHVIVVRARVDQHVVRCVGRPQQLRSGDGHEVRPAVELDQLGRSLRRVDRRDGVRERRLRIRLRPAIEQIDGVCLRELLRDLVEFGLDERADARLRPGPGNRARREPAVVDVNVVAVASFEDQRARVDDAAQERVIGDRLRHRCAIDRHEDRRRLADDHLRRRVADRHRGWLDAGGGERRLQAIE